MIERKIVAHKLKEFQIKEFIAGEFRNAGICAINLKKTPLGDKVVISTSRPGLIVGRKGKNIKQLTTTLKNKFNLDNPELEINEIKDIYLNAIIVSNTIASSLEKFGSQRFKGVAHTAMQHVLEAGAKGVEILVAGKVPSARARVWRFYQGYLKKSGDAAVTQVDIAYSRAELKTGTVGIKVSIMPGDAVLPDAVDFLDVKKVEEIVDEEIQKDVLTKSQDVEVKKEEPLPEAEVEKAEGEE
ncbi:30S ribosomal protein S3 [Candidatus Woesearchaeota archaeon]|nr:30S ribosomal protein S3 [Candidatus Woesearchaeota archaeon]